MQLGTSWQRLVGMAAGFLVLAASSLHPSRAGATEQPPRHRYRVAAMGDSLTDPRSHGGLYLKYLKERCPKSTFDSYGRGGEMVNQMRRRFTADILGSLPDGSGPSYTHVIVLGGVNDLYSDLTANRTLEKIQSDLSTMYAAAKARGLSVIALTVTPWGGFKKYYTPARFERMRALNAWILSQPAAKTVDFAVDAYPLLSCGTPELICPAYAEPFHDGLHFGPEGHRRIAAELARRVFSDCE